MPRHTFKYPPEIRETPVGKHLYGVWLRIRMKRSPEFENYTDFYAWSMANGYREGTLLQLLDEEKDYSPDNCVWRPANTDGRFFGEAAREWVAKWNKTVNRFRVYYGMEPFPEEVECDA